MASGITLPNQNNMPTNSSNFTPGSTTGLMIPEVDSNGNVYEWAWHGGIQQWLSPYSIFTGSIGQNTIDVSNSISSQEIFYQLCDTCSKTKIWLVKSTILILATTNIPTINTNNTYYQTTINELRGINNYKFNLNTISSKGIGINQYTVYEQSINQIFDSRLIDWHFIFKKTGLDLINIKLHFSLEYKIVR